MAGIGEPPIEDKPPDTSKPVAFWHLVVQVVLEGGKAVGADVAVKKGIDWFKKRGSKGCTNRGKPVKKSWKHCPECGKEMPPAPELHP
jgi:hypothetical protein